MTRAAAAPFPTAPPEAPQTTAAAAAEERAPSKIWAGQDASPPASACCHRWQKLRPVLLGQLCTGLPAMAAEARVGREGGVRASDERNWRRWTHRPLRWSAHLVNADCTVAATCTQPAAAASRPVAELGSSVARTPRELLSFIRIITFCTPGIAVLLLSARAADRRPYVASWHRREYPEFVDFLFSPSAAESCRRRRRRFASAAPPAAWPCGPRHPVRHRHERSS